MDKRKGKQTIGARTTVPIAHVEPQACSLEEAVDIVVKVKRAKNLKQRTIKGYITNMRYFIDWTTERYGEIHIHDVTVGMLRENVLWCSEEKEYYEGHPFKADFEKEKRGLAASSVNVRIRVLRRFFNVLHQEGIIDKDPAQNVSLMRQDEDTVEPLTDEEIQRLMKAPDKNQWAQWRDYIIMALILDRGIRLNEVCSLEKTEINFAKRQIVLPASKNKNRKSRILPLSTETVRLLKQLSEESILEQHGKHSPLSRIMRRKK